MKNIFKKFVLLCILIITAFVVNNLLNERKKYKLLIQKNRSHFLILLILNF